MAEHSKLILTSTNQLLDYFTKVPYLPYGFPPNEKLAEALNVSTTTILKIIRILCEKGVARKDGPNKILLRRPTSSDYFSSEEVENTKVDLIEKEVLRRISAYELEPGDRFSELKLSRSLKSSTVIVREALLKIAQIGIIKKHPGQKWEVVRFSGEMVEEISAIRVLYENYSLQVIEKLKESDPIWNSFRELRNLHTELLQKENILFEDLINMERSFHSTLIKACQNRFIEDSYNSAFTLIHYHLWQIEYDRPKITRVLEQHLNILESLLQRDFGNAIQSMEIHLRHAKNSMKLVNEEMKENGKDAEKCIAEYLNR